MLGTDDFILDQGVAISYKTLPRLRYMYRPDVRDTLGTKDGLLVGWWVG